jgi:DNA-binding NarL/FixJ family response regulator
VDDMNTPATPPRVRVVLADDEALMRAGLRLMIDGADGIEVVGEAADGKEAVAATEEHRPDVVLMDVRMPHLDGIEATREIMAAAPDAGPAPSTRVVMLTAFDTDEFLLEALRAGAVSFLLKDSPPEQVIRAVHDAAGGTPQFSPTVLRRLIQLARAHGDESHQASPVRSADDAATASAPPPAVPGAAPISTREWEVARLVAQGRTNSEIADQLFLSLPTVKTHIAHLFDKLQVTNRVQLAIRVLEEEGRA